MSAMYKFKSLDWVKNIVQANHNSTKKHVDPTAAFNFEEDFSVGTIHGKNDTIHTRTIGKEATEVIKLTDNNSVSVLSSKTQDELVALIVQERRRSMLTAGTWVATGFQASSHQPHRQCYRRSDRDSTRHSRGISDLV